MWKAFGAGRLTAILAGFPRAREVIHFQSLPSRRGSGDPRYSRSGDRRYTSARPALHKREAGATCFAEES